MFRLLFLFALLLFPALPAGAAVELGLPDQPKVTIDEVYLREGVPFLALEDILPLLDVKGDWDSVEHVYRIRTPRGTATISPGSRYLRIGERFVPLDPPPRFIDGRLRVSEEFVSVQLPSLLGTPLHYRNLSPSSRETVEEEGSLDKLFSFLLRKKEPEAGVKRGLRGIALDPGHGGQEPGALGPGGIKEKDIALGVAERLETQLKMRFGFPVYLSRDGDYGLSRKQRLETAAQPEVDVLLVLHAQAALSPLPRGMTLFVRPYEESAPGAPATGEGESIRLAQLLRAALADKGFSVADIVRAPLPSLGRGDLPTVLIELGYLTNPGDRELLADGAGQGRIADALFRGLHNFSEEQKEARP